MQLFYPNAGAIEIATLVRTGIAGAKIRLFKVDMLLSPSTTRADVLANEADFDGYGAVTIAAWLAVYIDPAGGASFQSGTVQFQYATPLAPPYVTNTVYGFWVESSGGDMIIVGKFDAGIAMAVDTDAIPLDVVLNYGRTA